MSDRERHLEHALLNLLNWTYGGSCSDCDMFRRAPSDIEFVHHKDCGHLESINQALVLLGRDKDEGHSYEDPASEMVRLAEERSRR